MNFTFVGVMNDALAQKERASKIKKERKKKFHKPTTKTM